jgi:hypothetical protein
VEDESLCPDALLAEQRLSPAAIGGIVAASAVGAALFSIGAFVAFRIVRSTKKAEDDTGGTAANFAAE